jgi:hypothetical protein
MKFFLTFSWLLIRFWSNLVQRIFTKIVEWFRLSWKREQWKKVAFYWISYLNFFRYFQYLLSICLKFNVGDLNVVMFITHGCRENWHKADFRFMSVNEVTFTCVRWRLMISEKQRMPWWNSVLRHPVRHLLSCR